MGAGGDWLGFMGKKGSARRGERTGFISTIVSVSLGNNKARPPISKQYA